MNNLRMKILKMNRLTMMKMSNPMKNEAIRKRTKGKNDEAKLAGRSQYDSEQIDGSIETISWKLMLINFKIFNSDKLKQEYKIIIAVKTKQENYIVFRNTLKEISCFLFYSLTSQIHSLGRIRTILKHFDLKIVFICVVSLQRGGG